MHANGERHGQLKRFAVAVRRQFRENAGTAGLESVLGGIEGVRVVGINGAHAQVEATEEAAAQLRSRLGDAYLVEELIDRHT